MKRPLFQILPVATQIAIIVIIVIIANFFGYHLGVCTAIARTPKIIVACV